MAAQAQFSKLPPSNCSHAPATQKQVVLMLWDDLCALSDTIRYHHAFILLVLEVNTAEEVTAWREKQGELL